MWMRATVFCGFLGLCVFLCVDSLYVGVCVRVRVGVCVPSSFIHGSLKLGGGVAYDPLDTMAISLSRHEI